MRLRVVTAAAQLCVVLMAVSTTATDPPPDWAPRIAAGNMLWSPDPTVLAANHFPVLGNGFIGWLYGQTTMNVAGVFNGYVSLCSLLYSTLLSVLFSRLLIMSSPVDVLDKECKPRSPLECLRL